MRRRQRLPLIQLKAWPLKRCGSALSIRQFHCAANAEIILGSSADYGSAASTRYGVPLLGGRDIGFRAPLNLATHWSARVPPPKGGTPCLEEACRYARLGPCVV